jgi:hypothetical protein
LPSLTVHARGTYLIIPFRIAEIVLDNCDEPLPIGVVLRMVALYWFTETFPRSLYPYRSLVTGEMMPMSKVKPLGYSHFPEEVVFVPKAWEGAAFPNMKFRRDHDVVSFAFVI